MKIIFAKNAWEDYIYWQDNNKRIAKKVNSLIKDTIRHPFEGKGKPEPLRFDLAGLWSRRIDKNHRLVYKVKNENLLIYACRFHYE